MNDVVVRYRGTPDRFAAWTDGKFHGPDDLLLEAKAAAYAHTIVTIGQTAVEARPDTPLGAWAALHAAGPSVAEPYRLPDGVEDELAVLTDQQHPVPEMPGELTYTDD